MRENFTRRGFRDLPSVARHGFLLVTGGVFLVPFYIAIVNVFKTRDDIFASPLGIPFARLTLDNIARNLDTPHFNVGIAYGTSVVISSVTVALVVILGAAMSYVL